MKLIIIFIQKIIMILILINKVFWNLNERFVYFIKESLFISKIFLFWKLSFLNQLSNLIIILFLDSEIFWSTSIILDFSITSLFLTSSWLFETCLFTFLPLHFERYRPPLFFLSSVEALTFNRYWRALYLLFLLNSVTKHSPIFSTFLWKVKSRICI